MVERYLLGRSSMSALKMAIMKIWHADCGKYIIAEDGAPHVLRPGLRVLYWQLEISVAITGDAVPPIE